MELAERLDQILKQKEVTFSTFAEHIGIPEDQLRASLEKSSLEIRVLEKISKELKIPLYRFFREPLGDLLDACGSGELSQLTEQELSSLKLQLKAAQKEIQILKQELESKNQLINELQLRSNS